MRSGGAKVPTAQQLRTLIGSRVRIRLLPEAGGGEVEGRLVGALEAADGLVVFLEPTGADGRRLSWNYQHLAAVEPAD